MPLSRKFQRLILLSAKAKSLNYNIIFLSDIVAEKGREKISEQHSEQNQETTTMPSTIPFKYIIPTYLPSLADLRKQSCCSEDSVYSSEDSVCCSEDSVWYSEDVSVVPKTVSVVPKTVSFIPKTVSFIPKTPVCYSEDACLSTRRRFSQALNVIGGAQRDKYQ